MKYNDELKRPRVDKRTKQIGMKCSNCNNVFYHDSIVGITKCNACSGKRKKVTT